MVYLSHNYFIRILLNIKDKNISFEKNFISDKIIKKINSKIFHPKLTYKPEYCPCCCNKKEPVIKYVFNKPSLITLPKISNFNTYTSLLSKRENLLKTIQINYYLTKVVNLLGILVSNLIILSVIGCLNIRDKACKPNLLIGLV